MGFIRAQIAMTDAWNTFKWWGRKTKIFLIFSGTCMVVISMAHIVTQNFTDWTKLWCLSRFFGQSFFVRCMPPVLSLSCIFISMKSQQSWHHQHQIKTAIVKSYILIPDNNGIMFVIHTCTAVTSFAGFRLYCRLS